MKNFVDTDYIKTITIYFTNSFFFEKPFTVMDL